MRTYDAQLFARCHKLDVRLATRAARILEVRPSEFIRDAVREKTVQVLRQYMEEERLSRG